MNLVERITQLHGALKRANIPHAFGGALALAWCTQQARATIDIDVNLFVTIDRAEAVYNALASAINVSEEDRTAIDRDGQTRLWWDETPVDVFFNTTPFHAEVARRARVEQFAGEDVPFLACRDLAVFKAFFNRTKDWADLEEMHAAGLARQSKRDWCTHRVPRRRRRPDRTDPIVGLGRGARQPYMATGCTTWSMAPKIV